MKRILLLLPLAVLIFVSAFVWWYIYYYISPRISSCLARSSTSSDSAIIYGTIKSGTVRGQDYVFTIAPCGARQLWPVSTIRFIVPVRGVGVVKEQGQGAGRTYVFGSAAPELLFMSRETLAVRISKNPLASCDDAWCNSQKSFLADRASAQSRLVTAIAGRDTLGIVLTLLFTRDEFIASNFAEISSPEQFKQIIQEGVL